MTTQNQNSEVFFSWNVIIILFEKLTYILWEIIINFMYYFIIVFGRSQKRKESAAKLSTAAYLIPINAAY